MRLVKILCHQAIRHALATITGAAQHSLMQSMLFDQNTATDPHQDWYYTHDPWLPTNAG